MEGEGGVFRGFPFVGCQKRRHDLTSVLIMSVCVRVYKQILCHAFMMRMLEEEEEEEEVDEM